MVSLPKNKKILVLSSTFPRWVGDTNSPFVFDLSQGLSKNFRITVLAPHFPGSKCFETMNNLRVFRFRYFISRFEQLTGGILPLLKKNKLYFFVIPFFIIGQLCASIRLSMQEHPNLIHAHWIVPQGLTAFIIKKIFNTPYIVTSHGSDLHTLKFNFLKKVILNNADKITVVSNQLLEEIRKIDPKLVHKTEVIPMGVDTSLFNPKKANQSLRKKYDIQGKLLLFVGRLAPEKGLINLIEAMSSIVSQHPKTKLLIVGGGPLETELKLASSRLGLTNNIVFVGPVKHQDLPPYFATADVFVSPSLKEGSPVTYLEAMASGKFLAVGDIPISRELISSSSIGVVLQPNSDDISRKINTVISQHKTNRHVDIHNEYTLDYTIKKFTSIYQGI